MVIDNECLYPDDIQIHSIITECGTLGMYNAVTLDLLGKQVACYILSSHFIDVSTSNQVL